MANPNAVFGAYLRELRLKAGFGLRKFAEVAGFQPSNLSNLERGKLRPPRDPERLEEMADALGLVAGTPERQKLYDLAARAQKAPLPADVQPYARSHQLVPVLLRTAQDKNLTDDELQELIQHINEHY